jgi:hypothetical protein
MWLHFPRRVMYNRIFKYSLVLSLKFARKGQKVALEDFKEFLQEKGIHVLELKGRLFIIDQYDEVVAKISPHPSGGFEIADVSPNKISR